MVLVVERVNNDNNQNNNKIVAIVIDKEINISKYEFKNEKGNSVIWKPLSQTNSGPSYGEHDRMVNLNSSIV